MILLPRTDKKGRVIIPADIRERLGIREGDHLELRHDGRALIFFRKGGHV